VRLAGNDTATFEKRPAAYGGELFSVHMMLLADHGISIMENANLDPIHTPVARFRPASELDGTGRHDENVPTSVTTRSP
jgi:hypothetical protein